MKDEKILDGAAMSGFLVNNMNKKEVLSSLTIIANKLDDSGRHQSADALTEVARRVAQYDDDYDFGDFENQDRFEPVDDYNAYEERQLDLDRWHESQEGMTGFGDIQGAIDDVMYTQSGGNNVSFEILEDEDGHYYAMPSEEYESNGSDYDWRKTIPPMTEQELMAFRENQQREYEDIPGETPLGMELDGGSDIDFDY